MPPVRPMRFSRLLLGTAVSSLALLPLAAQAQTVQLPTQRQFSVGTTVLVPDRGTISLGSVSRARESSNRRGLFGGGPLTQNRGIGRELSHSGATISATIIDLQELDRQVLAEARRQRSGSTAAIDPRRIAFAKHLTQHMGKGPLYRNVRRTSSRRDLAMTPTR